MFSATFESLHQFECPEWFRDAKFGFWSHWGPQSVPMLGDWYARNMYVQDHEQYRWHCRRYGHPSTFGYKDLVKRWKAERFDPEGLMDLYVKAGARYFVAQAMHHDHFFNYPSKLNPFNAGAMGPGKDICGLWQKAARKHGLPFGLSEHLGASYYWTRTNKGSDATGPYAGVPYDGNDPQYRDFYIDNFEMPTAWDPAQWLNSPDSWRSYWLDVMKELIDAYQPDLLYTDSGLPFALQDSAPVTDAGYRYGLEAVSYLYNASAARHGRNRAVYTQKNRREEIHSIGVMDIERSQLPDIQPRVWQSDTCLGGWFYAGGIRYKTARHIAEMLVDIVSKNGVMLLNILQKPDGSLDDETRFLLDELAAWRPVLDEAVVGSRPWKTAGEGETRVVIDGFREDQVAWGPGDYRFTRKGNTVYAFLLNPSADRVAVLRSFRDERVEAVRLLGAGDVPFTQPYGILNVRLPDNLPMRLVNCLAVQTS